MDDRKSVIASLKNRIFKILPLKEEGNAHLDVYIDSLCLYINGMLDMPMWSLYYNELHETVCVLSYLAKNDCAVAVCKREVFRLLHNLDRLGSVEVC